MTDTLETVENLEAALGEQFRNARLRKNDSQSVLANDADVSLGALQNLESGKGATVRTMVKVLRALGRQDWLQTLQPAVSISPMQHLLQSTTVRKRARKTK